MVSRAVRRGLAQAQRRRLTAADAVARERVCGRALAARRARRYNEHVTAAFSDFLGRYTRTAPASARSQSGLLPPGVAAASRATRAPAAR